MQEYEQIVSITTASGNIIYGLSNKGILYYFNANINDWTKAGE